MTGHGEVQTRSGRFYRTCSTGSSPSPSEATTHHRKPDQTQSRHRAAPHTRIARSSLAWVSCPARAKFYAKPCDLSSMSKLLKDTRGGAGSRLSMEVGKSVILWCSHDQVV